MSYHIFRDSSAIVHPGALLEGFRRFIRAAARYGAQAISLALFGCCLLAGSRAMAADSIPMNLTAEERAWLADDHVVRVRVGDFPPYMFSSPAPAGLSVDYLVAIAKRFGFRIELLPAVLSWPEALQDVMGSRQYYDLLPTMTPDPQRDKHFAVSKSYLSAPWVVYARKESPYIIGLESLAGKTVAAEKGYVITERLKSHFPAIRIMEVANSADALAAVATGAADAYVGNLALGAYHIRMNLLDNLVVAAPTPFGANVQVMGVRKDWPALASLISKGIDSMSAEERNALSQKWGQVEFKKRIDLTLIYWVIGIAGSVVLVTLFWLWRLAKEIATRKQTESALQAANLAIRQANEALERRVAERTMELRASNQQLADELAERQQARVCLQESEERFKALLNASFGGVAVHDKGLILDCNQGLADISGYSMEELIGMDGLLLIAPSARALVMDNIVRGYERPYEAVGLRKNGEEYPLRLQASNIRYQGKQMRSVEFRDITESKRGEAERQHLQAQLIQAQKMEAIGTLAGGIAHDFNNILAAVIGYAEMAKDACPSGSVIARDLDKVLNAGNRAAGLVKQILAFSRKGSTERIALEPFHLVEEAVKLLRPALPSTITIKLQLDPATKPILADPTQIHQIVMNLCTNAFHAMEQAGGILEITLNNRELTAQDLTLETGVKAGNFVALSIADTGPGIPPAIRERIFEPYFTTKEVGKGTGMGLSIVHGIVAAMGGFVTCESVVNSGSSFHVFFPAVEQEPAALFPSGDPLALGKEHILYVDDEALLAEMGKAMLERLGYTVTVFTSSKEALVAFKNQADRFDAVITDQTMPDITGIDLARQMLQIRPDIPIVLTTGHSNLVNEESAKAMGIKGFLMKPLSGKELARHIRAALGKNPPP